MRAIGAVLMTAVITACSHSQEATETASPSASPTPISTAALPVAPSPELKSSSEELMNRAKAAQVCGSGAFVSTAAVIREHVFIGCRNVTTRAGVGGAVAIVDTSMRLRRFSPTWMYSVESIAPAGIHAIAVSGYSDGAMLQNQLSLLDETTLKPIVDHPMSDSTFLGVIGDRAYIDDWCCFGRADQYAPATIYSISLKDGSESKHVDLAPDADSHPANLAPLGQGSNNYMLGHYFYVVVTDDNRKSATYRYDVFHLDRTPVRMKSPS